MTFASDIQKLAPGKLVELFELDATAIGGTAYRFHAGTNELQSSVVWQGNVYTPYPVDATGFEWSGRGTLPRPKVRVANIFGLISALCLEHDDLVGAKLTRKRTFVKYLDAVNFTAGNPNADPNAGFADEVWFIERKAGENKIFAEFELSTSFDVQGIKIPRRQTIQNVCPWKYKSAECSYVPGAMFTDADVATGNPALDKCGKRLTSCKLRFGTYAQLPHGGFPGVGLVR